MRRTCLAVAASAAGLLLAAPADAAQFQAPANYAAGSGPTAVALGDFNGDGKLDAAVTNDTATSSDVSVLLGGGDGKFAQPVKYSLPPGAHPSSVAVGDFNGDGKLDLAVADAGTGSVLIFLGKGDGTFTAGATLAVGTAPSAVVAGDFNGDGKLDLAVADPSGPFVWVLLGNGDGTFKAPVHYDAHGSPQSIAVGDFNGDGKLDLAVANNGSNDVSLLLGNGDGSFKAPLNQAVAASPISVASGDFNGDGKLDLAVANNGSSNVSVLLGNGDGSFGSAVNYGVGSLPISVRVGDFNGDGTADLVVADHNTNDVSLLLGNGDGSFQPAVKFPVDAKPNQVAVGELNGDLQPDLVTANFAGADLSVLLNTAVAGVGLSPTPVSFPTQLLATASAPRMETVTNTGNGVLRVAAGTLVGANAADFALTADGCVGHTLVVGASCQLSLGFTPIGVGPRSATLALFDNAPGGLQGVAITGNGRPPAPALAKLRITPPAIIAESHGGVAARARKTGARVSYTDSEVATTKFSVQYPAGGVLRRGSCVAPPRHGKPRGRRCTRFITITAFYHGDHVGSNSLHFTGRAHGRKLARGHYRLVARATNTRGRSGRPVAGKFRVIG